MNFKSATAAAFWEFFKSIYAQPFRDNLNQHVPQITGGNVRFACRKNLVPLVRCESAIRRRRIDDPVAQRVQRLPTRRHQEDNRLSLFHWFLQRYFGNATILLIDCWEEKKCFTSGYRIGVWNCHASCRDWITPIIIIKKDYKFKYVCLGPEIFIFIFSCHLFMSSTDLCISSLWSERVVCGDTNQILWKPEWRHIQWHNRLSPVYDRFYPCKNVSFFLFIQHRIPRDSPSCT